MFSLFGSKKISKSEYSTDYNVSDSELIGKISKENRKALETVTDWIPEHIFKGSYFNYGIPDFLRPIINLPIGDERTYTDIVTYYSRFFDNVNYLELGVSVGKNFFQLLHKFKNSKLTAYDVENINPVLKDQLQFQGVTEWPTKEGSLRTEPSTLSKFSFGTNNVEYLAGDIWDEGSWEKLQGNKFNMIFSDALHDPKALLWEYKMIKKYQLLDTKFIIFWDDLSHGLEESFYEIAKDLKKVHKLDKNNIVLGKINGWCGVHESKHDVGIVSNINLH